MECVSSQPSSSSRGFTPGSSTKTAQSNGGCSFKVHFSSKRPAPANADFAVVPSYAVIQHSEEEDVSLESIIEDGAVKPGELPIKSAAENNEKRLTMEEVAEPTTYATQERYKELMAQGKARHDAKLCEKRGPLGWAMRTLRDNPMGRVSPTNARICSLP